MFETTTRQYVRASVTDTKTKYLKPSVSKHNLTYTATSQQTTLTKVELLIAPYNCYKETKMSIKKPLVNLLTFASIKYS